MNKHRKKLVASGVIVSLSSFVPAPFFFRDALAQATASAVLTVQAQISNPLGLKAGGNANAGTWAIGGTGTIKITAGGGTSISSGFVISAGNIGGLTITAPKSAPFTLSIPTYKATVVKITNGGGGAPSKSMTAKSIKFGNVANLSGVTGTFKFASEAITGVKVTTGTTGKAAIGVSIVFGADQVTGAYSGTYTLRITF